MFVLINYCLSWHTLNRVILFNNAKDNNAKGKLNGQAAISTILAKFDFDIMTGLSLSQMHRATLFN